MFFFLHTFPTPEPPRIVKRRRQYLSTAPDNDPPASSAPLLPFRLASFSAPGRLRLPALYSDCWSPRKSSAFARRYVSLCPSSPQVLLACKGSCTGHYGYRPGTTLYNSVRAAAHNPLGQLHAVFRVMIFPAVADR